MADKKVHLQIITPNGVKVDGNADLIVFRATTGDMGVLPGHEARSAILDIGILRMINGSDEQVIAIFGGLAEIKDDKLTIITSLAELPEEIDRDRAEADKSWAEQRIQEGKDDLEIQQGHVRLRRSMVRIEVSAYPLLSQQGDDE